MPFQTNHQKGMTPDEIEADDRAWQAFWKWHESHYKGEVKHMAPEVFETEGTDSTTFKVYYNNNVIHEQEAPLTIADVRSAADEEGLRKFTAQDNATGRDLYSSDFNDGGFRGNVKIVSYNAPKSQ